MQGKIVSYVEIPAIAELDAVLVKQPITAEDYPPMKGIVPQKDYADLFLPRIFNATPALQPVEFLAEFFPEQSTGLITNTDAFTLVKKAFYLENYRFTDNLIWFYAQPAELMFNWMDSSMKVFAERNGRDTDNSKLTRSMYLWSAFVKMYSPAGDIAYFLRNMDILSSNFIRLVCLAQGFSEELSLANESYQKAELRNQVYLEVLRRPEFSALSIPELLSRMIFSGNCLIDTTNLTQDNLKSYAENLADKIIKESAAGLRIDDSREFLIKASTAQQIVYVPDDNGEVVFDLALLQRIVLSNPALQIFVVSNKEQVSNNVNQQLLEAILKTEYFAVLSRKQAAGSFRFIEINSFLDVPTVADLSRPAQEIVRQSNLVLVKGQMLYEYCDMYNLNPNTYHFFVSSSAGNNMLTGVKKNEAIVVRIPSAESKYLIRNKKHVEKTLLDLRNSSPS
ncbi:hypothetical protein NO2_0396 [Candidatus Termititenax persephonae]|uniref:Damage-control phosphatase ARMT1-like metal-binding domain-containing protein n=1 Tax=Candidatus Termititenax persephonae TaxID=2218525 RepID=A0A388THG9_9BACT|nr:hypothetical protein NO2_0396 [Candidatus Termititenax persephonae]